MSTHHCEECWAVLDPTKVLRCTKCKACFYCSQACQKRNWKLHKRVCSTDPSLRPFIRVEMAIERTLARLPKTKAPKDATCYICLEGDDGGKLMRGCACRGDSAGFVHLECLTELAMSKEASGDPQAAFDAWTDCGHCKQQFSGALGLEMTRRCWRRNRSSQRRERRYTSTRWLVTCLGLHGEVVATNQLLDDASTCVGNNSGMLLDLRLCRAELLINNHQNLEALGLLQAILPEAKEYTTNPSFYGLTLQHMARVLLLLKRYQEAHGAAAEHMVFAKAKFGLEDRQTLDAMALYGSACARFGLMEEAKATFEDVLTAKTRILGRDHPDTQSTMEEMRVCGFAGPL